MGRRCVTSLQRENLFLGNVVKRSSQMRALQTKQVKLLKLFVKELTMAHGIIRSQNVAFMSTRVSNFTVLGNSSTQCGLMNTTSSGFATKRLFLTRSMVNNESTFLISSFLMKTYLSKSKDMKLKKIEVNGLHFLARFES